MPHPDADALDKARIHNHQLADATNQAAHNLAETNSKVDELQQAAQAWLTRPRPAPSPH